MKTTHHSRPAPSRLLSSLLLRTGVLLFTSLGVSGVFAASTEIDTAGTSATVTGHKTLSTGAPNSGNISATIDNSSNNVSTVGPATNATISNTGALIAAKATGTTYSNAIDLSLIATTPVDGAASLLSGVNTGQINAAVSNSSLNVTATAFASGVVTNNSNSITAAATLNAGSTLISGNLPVAGYTSTTDGSADLRSAPTGVSPRVAAAGSIVASTYQNALNAGPQNGSGALLNNNRVTLTATSTTPGNTVSASPELNDNTLAAAYKGNTAATAIAIASGGGVGMTGSAVVTNLQANVTTNGVVASPATAAGNTNSLVSLSVDSSGASTNTNTLTGTASLLRSAISASATGNEATGNRITLADNVGFTGAMAGSISNNAASGTADGTTASSRADLVVANVQTNTGAPLPGNDFSTQLLASTTSNGDVRAIVQNLAGGSLNVNDSSVTASAIGNAAIGMISAAGNRAALDASSALTSAQVNTLAPVQSSNMNSDIVATIGTGLTNSPVNVNGSLQQASATGNQGAQTLSLSATDLNVNGASGILFATSNLSTVNASGVGASVTSAQTSVESSTTALTSAANVRLDASQTTTNVTGSALSATGGIQDAIALGGSAANNLTLSATTLSGNAGLVNAQYADAFSPTSANVSASSVQLLAGNSSANVVGSPLTVSGNLQRAIAYGATASNTVNIDANTANVPSVTGLTASQVSLVSGTASGSPIVKAQYGLANDQSTQSSVTAGVNASATPSFGISVGANLDGTSATNDGNAVLAVGYGNQAANGLALAVNTLEVPGGAYANVASVTNAQTVGDGANVSASSVSGAALVRTTVAGGVTQASVTASDNEVQTLAYGNRANSNTLAVTATTLSSVKSSGSVLNGSLTGSGATADAALTVQNAQYGGTGAVSATQTYGAGTNAPAVLIDVGTASGSPSTRSSLAADRNAFTASAYSNSATNGLSIEGGTIAASGGVQNMQASAKTVTATIGTAGTPEVLGASISVNASPTNVTPSGSTDTGQTYGSSVYGGWIRVENGLLTPSQASTFGWALGTTGHWYKLVSGYSISSPTMNVADGGDYLYNASAGGTPAYRNSGGVLISARGAVTNSDLSVSGSVANATAVGNSSSNSLDLTKGTTVTANGFPTASSSVTSNSSLSSAADYNVSNAQRQIGSATATAIGSYGIDDGLVPNTGTLAITGSTLKVDGNQQQATAQGNTGSNRLTLEANTLTGVSATNNLSGAINSLQNSSASVAATSNAEYFAPAVSTNSQLSISGNRNVALGNRNAVVNTLSATGNSVAPTNAISTDASLALTSGTSATATGAWVLNNVQDSAGSTLGSTALSQIYNEDRGATSSTGLLRSTLNIDGNVNLSEATVNRATNTFTVLANQMGTTAGLANSQTSSTAVTSTANSLVGVTLAGSVTDAVINAGTVTLDNNITSALAKGNSATNVLNYGATAGYTNLGTTGTSTQNSVSNVQNASAVAALGNSQVNSGNVVASANNTTYAVALNSLGGGSVLGGNVSVANNYVAATGYGNEAINQLSVSALNSGTPTAALANYQRNSGAVTVTASNVTFNVLATGGALTGSTVRTMGNQITATATGNSAVSSILAR